jgi:hypothetical protein
MKQIVGTQSSGKTRELMEFAKINNAIFVCENAYAMRAKALGYGITGLEIMGYYEFLTQYPMATQVETEKEKVPNFVVDEIVRFMNYLYFGSHGNNEFIGYSLTLLDEE